MVFFSNKLGGEAGKRGSGEAQALTRVLPPLTISCGCRLSAGVLPKCLAELAAFRRCVVSENRPIVQSSNRPIVRLPFSCILLVVLYRQTGTGQLVDTVRDASICDVCFRVVPRKNVHARSRECTFAICLLQAACAASAASLLARLMSAETVSDASRRVLFDRWL
jgi:hypothetical protein